MNDNPLRFDIDSFKLRIPLSKIKEYPTIINDRVHTVSETTGEIYGTKEQKTATLHTNNRYVSFIASIEQQSIDGNRIGTKSQFLTLKLTSKLLTDQYFSGIRKDNIDIIHRTVLGQGIDVSREDFINSELTDIDFKSDIPKSSTNIATLRAFSYQLMHNTNKVELVKKHNHSFKQKNTGVWFNDRKSATTAYPYIKIYDKSIELRYKSTDFANEYLRHQDTDFWRLEYTLKGKSMFDKYGINNTLKSMLELDYEAKTDIAKSIWQQYVNPDRKVLDVSEKSKLDELALSLAISYMIADGYTQSQVIDCFCSGVKNRSTKQKWKAKIEATLSSISWQKEQTKKAIEQNEKVYEAMKIFCVI